MVGVFLRSLSFGADDLSAEKTFGQHWDMRMLACQFVGNALDDYMRRSTSGHDYLRRQWMRELR